MNSLDTTTTSGHAAEGAPPTNEHTTSAAPADTPPTARRGRALPLIAFGLGMLSLALVIPLTVVAWPLMVAALVCGIIAVRRRHRMWGWGAAAIVLFALSVLTMFVPPAQLTVLAFAAGGRSDVAGDWWNMFWGLCMFWWFKV
jgi:hypothetical protein